MKYTVTFLTMNDYLMFLYRLANSGNEEMDDRLQSIIQNNEVEKWLRDIQASLPSSLMDELKVFFQADSMMALSLVPTLYKQGALESLAGLTKGVESLNDNVIQQVVTTTGFIDEKVEKQSVEKRIQSLAVPEQEKWKLLYFVSNPEELKQRLVSLLNNMWSYYEEHQSMIETLGHEAEETFQSEEYQQFAMDLAEQYVVNTGDPKQLIAMPSYSSNLGFSVMEGDGVILLTVGMARYQMIRKFHNDKEVLELLKLLTDERRFQMLRLLKKRPHYGYEIAQALGVSNSTVSHHLALLLNQGFVKSDRDENKVYYTLNQAELKQVIEALNQLFLGEE
ncbi:ArsR/SmtB family transcription factor [Alkalibacillus salilacus]|uniref:Transcriptional regulator n=1 Tax=Alkalibacillus salilacus TaxID=284582 RepID=A0ABT9VAV2_9BACI|nr:metalloregulator ArsR/SmtB family transcription factor [Alkalibacillus salilacus]MDQ0158094.1 putative transcriptional regulator [Alkalibacillus salilacus]